MRGEARRHFALDGLQGLVGMRAGERMKNVRHAAKHPAASFQRRDGVVERWLVRSRCDGLDLALMLGDGAVEGRAKMLGLYPAKGRDAEGARPVFEQWIRRLNIHRGCAARLTYKSITEQT